MSEEVKPRGSKPSLEGRFIWISNLVHERINNAFGTQATHAVAIYAALCRLSQRNKENPAVVIASVSQIAGLCRLGYRKTFDVLHGLAEQAKVISITPGQREIKEGRITQPPNIYTLLSLRLHNKQSDRLHNKQSSDCTGSTPSNADIQIDSLPKGERVIEEGQALPSAGAVAPPSACPSGERNIHTWRGSCEV